MFTNLFTNLLFWILYWSFINNKYKSIISNNLVSLTHALITIVGSAYILCDNHDNHEYISNSLSIKLINFSAFYFIYDCLFMLLNKFSLMFFLHHLLILGVYYIALTYDYGYKLVILTLFWGEITNPLQITWFLSRMLNYKKLEHYIFPVFSFNFIIIRTAILPIIHYTMISTLFKTTEYYYPTIGISILSILGTLGGMLWSKKMIKKLNFF
jgi:hypothetical protein